MLMKNLVFILTLIMIGQLTAPAGTKQPLPQTDEQLRKLIVGYWLDRYKDSMGILWRGTETVALDGTLATRSRSSPEPPGKDIAWGGTWQIKNGIFLETVKHTPVFHGPNAERLARRKLSIWTKESESSKTTKAGSPNDSGSERRCPSFRESLKTERSKERLPEQ